MFLFKNTNVNIPVSTNDRIKGSIIGFIVGDALGVPVEFIDRETLKLAEQPFEIAEQFEE